MADLNQKRAQLAEFRERLARTEQERQETLAALASNQDTIPRIERSLARAQAEGDTARAAFDRQNLESARQTSIQLADVLRREEQFIAELQTGIQILEQDITDAEAQSDQGPGTESSGSEVAQASQARDQSANAQNPPVPPEVEQQGEIAPDTSVTPTSAQRPDTGNDSGTDAAVRTVQQTQATSGTTAGAAQSVARDDAVTADTRAGVGAPSDDGIPPNANPTRQAINQQAAAQIQPQPNVLDRCSSYTYSFSIYIMDPDQYSALLIDRDTAAIPPRNLLIQSGGAASDGRNPYFGLDYYIDRLQLTSLVSGKGTNGPHNVTEMEFRITEPYGITLLPNLFRATQEFVATRRPGSQGPQNYAAQNFLMVIRFYGYDEKGAPVRLNQRAAVDSTPGSAIPPIAEKFIPFQFTNIQFTIANRVTEYTCRAVCPQNIVATGQGRGIIPYNLQLTGTTVRDLLTGSGTGSARVQEPQARDDTQSDTGAAPPPKASTAPRANVVVRGLAAALNHYQQQQVDLGVQRLADQYEFVFADAAIADARVKPPGQTDLRSTGQSPAATAADAKLGSRQSVDRDAKNFTVTAGQSIVQFLDMVMRNSTYVYDQQSWIYDPRQDILIPQGVPANSFAWYRVGVQSQPLGYDDIRNDYAYRITYQISIYLVNALNSDYFPQGRFRGTHKKYDYWFTGENTSIRRFEQNFDYLYYTTVNVTNNQRTSGTADYREIEKRLYQPRSPESSQYSSGSVGEPAANAADRLYSPSDQGRLTLGIVGDPAWIQQGELWTGVGGPSVADTVQSAFLSDGTINYERQEVLFEVAFNAPADYDLKTGIMPIKRAQ